jgi:hypothetical protein
VHRPYGVRHAQYLDRPLDLPPLAEMDDIADGAAAVGALGGLDHGELAEQGHQLVGLIEPGTIDMNIGFQVRAPLPVPGQ